jgi:hypothetical protein
MSKRQYSSPTVTELGDLATLTLGNMGSFNDGGGQGGGMAEVDGMGMDGDG